MEGRVLVVAGSDSGGGAGLQADVKTVTALGGYAATAVTALTSQNTVGVQAIHDVPAAFVTSQMESIADDIGADCIKTGMLHTREIIDAVVDFYESRASHMPLVVDPVMFAKDGTELLQQDTSQTLKARLILRAALLTPNVPEAIALTGLPITSFDEMEHAATMLLTLGPKAVLLKGGHLEGNVVRDILVAEQDFEFFDSPRIDTRHTHGTGCTLASAVAVGIAQGLTVRDATVRAREYLRKAIETAPGFGAGHGPLNHAHTVVLDPESETQRPRRAARRE
ncbi:MAG: bifunctional hydroxymethylpyrimidine kinase/phosphomethylpyrimidine kinase [Alphaproteobacteria bacterium]|nr:bifunctional hydroxymethylpyrimidine kinase/phosphomethylpyrimidine kinase [Alphaproteobacteria bacterium]|tara:strand:+ start:9702 stop:10544 length:843 start_codon:yes stop_codon:yes gene_type:complete